MPLLTQNQRINLHKYIYRGGDLSPIYQHVLSPFAQVLVNHTPIWMAPNAITLTGLIVSVSSSMFALLFNPTLSSHGPRWLSLYAAISLLVYQTMDNMDGKQARRTNSSSPLGMLFDHGCDAINAGVFSISLASTLGTGWSVGIFFGLWCGFVPFFFSTWEEYYLGEMFLLPINGPTEGILIGAVMCLISYLYGSDWWHQTLFQSIYFESVLISPFRIMVVVAVIGGLITVSLHIKKVWNSRKSQRLNMAKPLCEVLPFVVFFISSFLWCATSRIALSSYPVCTVTLISIIFVELTVHIMLMCICNDDLRPFERYLSWATPFLPISVLLPKTEVDWEAWFLILYWISAFFMTTRVIILICRECAEELGIYVFHLGPRFEIDRSVMKLK